MTVESGSAIGSWAGRPVHDALPYFDSEMSTYKEYVDYLVGQEMEEMRRARVEIEIPPEARSKGEGEGKQWKSAVGAYVRELAATAPSSMFKEDGVDMERYALEGMEPPARKITNEENVQQWKKALERLEVALEYENTNVLNLELLQTYGVACWKRHMEFMSMFREDEQEVLNEVNTEIQHINLERKRNHVKAGETLDTLKQQYYQLIYRNAELEAVCDKLEARVKAAKAK
eukprot:Nk52_evm82s230 gene=Nk52_evmTU82s230